MSQAVREALSAIRDLGPPEALRAAAVATPDWAVNSHIHLPPNFSAFESVEQALDLAAAQHVRVLGVSNYYDYDVYGPFAAMARRRRIFPLLGLEIICLVESLQKAGVKINDPGNPGKMYLCGKGITRLAPFTPEAQRLLDIIRRNDSTRMAAMVRRMGEVFSAGGLDLGLDEAQVKAMVVRRHGSPPHTVYLQERHICQAFQERLFQRVPEGARVVALTRVLGAAPACGETEAVKTQNEIRNHLMKAGKPAYINETFIGFDDACRLVLELGGIPCYPTLADGARPVCPYEEPVEQLISRIRENRIYCAEFIPIRNSAAVLRRYVMAMRRAGLVVTAGTEHNTLDLLPLEPTCLGGEAIPADVMAIFREGAAVVAAHQYLALHGQCGLVDPRGRPNTAYAGDEQRIAALAQLGAVVIEKYLGSVP